MILRFARTGSGDVNALHGDMAGAFRLRLGDYRVLFTFEDDAMRIFGVRFAQKLTGDADGFRLRSAK
jgi:mRNA-degrading endonuclease RelE of RelBE toxin-antitoxin system